MWVCRYGEPGGRAIYCAEHQQEGMVDLKVRLHFKILFRNLREMRLYRMDMIHVLHLSVWRYCVRMP